MNDRAKAFLETTGLILWMSLSICFGLYLLYSVNIYVFFDKPPSKLLHWCLGTAAFMLLCNYWGEFIKNTHDRKR